MKRTSLRLCTLGPVTLTRADGTDVAAVLSQPKRLALLVYLAVANHGGFCRRDTVLGVFWPEFDQERARAALRKALHFLRHELDSEVIVGRGDEEIGVDPARLTCDANDFHTAVKHGELETALGAYAGEFLDGFHVSDTPEFEEWTAATRRELHDHALDAAERLAHAASEANDLRGAIRWATKWVRLAPTDEAATGALMAALTGTGQRARALRAYDQLIARLRDAGLEPSQAIRSFADHVRQDNTDVPLNQERNTSIPLKTTTARPRHRSLAAVTAAAAVIIASGFGVVRLTTGSSDNRPTVKVDALVNLTDDASLTSVGRVYQRAMADGLAQISRVRVSAEGTGTAPTLTVSGSFHRIGDSLEFVTEIIDRARGRTLPAPPPIRTIATDPAARTADVRRRVMATVSYYTSTWHPTVPGRRPPDWEAYQTFQEAFYTTLGWLSGEGEAVARADSLLRRVIELDPLYSEAYLLLGNFVLSQQRPPSPRAVFYQRGRYAAMDSLASAMRARVRPLTELDRTIADGLESFARADYASMLRSALAQEELLPSRPHVGVLHASAASNNPSVALSHWSTENFADWVIDFWLSWWWLLANHHMQADYEGEAAVVDSANARPYLRFPWKIEKLRAHTALGDMRRVRAITQNLNFNLAHFGGLDLRAHGLDHGDDDRLAESHRLMMWIVRWYEEAPNAWFRKLISYWALSLQGRGDELVRNLEGMARDSAHLLDIKGMLAVAYARQGDSVAADSIDQVLAAADPSGMRGLLSLWRARIAAQLGAKEQAVRLLDQAFREGTWFQPNMPVDGGFWHTDPDFEPLRGYPPYERLIAPQ